MLMEELHTDSIDGAHEANYGLGHVPGRGRTPTYVFLFTAFYSKQRLPYTSTDSQQASFNTAASDV
jgi:hypothetical protein